MEALFATCKQVIADITRSCVASEVYAAECLKLAKYVAKCALVLTEVELYMYEEQSLRGSQSLFLAVDVMASALKQVQQLMEQFGRAGGGGVWPLEDAVEFEAVALELQNAMIGLSKTKTQLPIDVQEDLQHFVRQLGELQFTTSELAEIEELVENTQQRTPRSPGGPGTAQQPGSPFDRRPGPAAAAAAAAAPGAIRVAPLEGGAEAGGGAAAAEGVAKADEEPSSPLPDDPFNMDSRLQSSTVQELEDLKLTSSAPQEASLGSLAEESLLEAQEDNQGILEMDPSPDEADEVLASLRQLAEAGRAQEEAVAEEGEEGEGERTLGELVQEVVAMMDEDEDREEEKEERGRRAAQQAQQQDGEGGAAGAEKETAAVAAGGAPTNGSSGGPPAKPSETVVAVVAEELGLEQ